jgi:predicted amidohydrolase YtcJ
MPLTGVVNSAMLVLTIALAWFGRTCLAEFGVSSNATGSLPYRDGSLRGDLVLHNGQLHTMDEHGTIASVLAIKDGLIVYIGDSKPVALANFASAPKTVDLKGRMAIPGLIDCHNHMVLFGNRPGYHTPLENAYSIADVQETYRRRAASVPPQSFVTTIGGFNPNQFKEGRMPTLAELDAAVPDKPVMVQVGFSGPTATNSRGKAFFEALDSPPTVLANGTIPAGNDTGRALLALRQQLTLADRKRGVVDAMAYAASLGVTTHLDQGAFQASGTPADGAGHEDNYHMHLPFLSVYDEQRGSVRLRINFLHMDATADLPTLGPRLLNAFKFFGGDMVRTGAIGEFIAANYSGGPVFDEAARRIAAAGWRLEVHSITADDYKTQVEAFERVHAMLGIGDLRWVIAHVPAITDEYLARLKRVGGGVNLSSYQYLAGRGPAAGPPFRRIVDSGIPAGIGADGMQIAPMNPWVHAYYATTGKSARGEVINVGQQITRKELLHLYTRANQWFLGGPDEKLLGSLEVGRLGDVVVLSEDYYTVSDENLRKLRSLLTVVGGVVVHEESGI